jgi:DNA polymerase-3 subunit gamma/tau
MASQSLYRKWRSQTFSDLVGQEPIVRTLCNAVRDGRLAHAYLFCGPRGTGKTSAARLLAKAVNCANPHEGEPCNECLSCREIAAGRSPDVIEIDAASNNSVDDIRELRGNVNVLTTGGRFKVYVIDEAHMLSTQAFNALLKTLEEPPAHVIFVLATTEAHKMLPTIVSRCQRFDFRRHTRRNIVARLGHVAAGEGLTLEPAAADLLARAAQGGMRDALSLLDQAMAFCGDTITLDGVRSMLGLADAGAVRALVEHVAAGRAAEGLQLIHEMVEVGADLRQLNSQIAEFWRALVLARAGADVARIMDCDAEEAREYADLARQFAIEELTACARIFAANETPARGLPVPQLGLELSFLECVGIRRRGGALAAVSATVAPPPTPRAAPTPAAPAPLPGPATEAPAGSPRSPAAAAPAPRVEELDLAAIERGATSSTPSSPMRAEEPVPSPTPGEEHPASPLPLGEGSGVRSTDWLRRAQEQWELVKKVCKQKKRTIAAFLNNARPIEATAGNPVEIVLEADFDFHLKSLREPENRAGVEWALEQVLGQPCHVRLVLAGSGGAAGGAASRGSSGGGRAAEAESPGTASSAHTSRPGAPGRGATPRADGPTNQQPSRDVAGNGHQAHGIHETAAGAAEAAWETVVSGANPAGGATAAGARETTPPSLSALEAEARADPVVQAIVRTFPAELKEVSPLDPANEE